jgi:lipooligosaccharide transport system ATP-binding protein
MDKAKIVAEGSPRQLIEQYVTREVLELRFPAAVQDTLDGKLDGIGERHREAAGPRAGLLPPTARRPPPLPTPAVSGPETSLVRRSSLEDVFLRLTGPQPDRVVRRWR